MLSYSHTAAGVYTWIKTDLLMTMNNSVFLAFFLCFARRPRPGWTDGAPEAARLSAAVAVYC